MTQCDWILAQLKRGKSLTALEATRAGIFRLAARVAELRERQWPIRSTLIQRDGKRFARYTLTR